MNRVKLCDNWAWESWKGLSEYQAQPWFWLIDAIAESQNLSFKSSKDFQADYSIMNRKNNRLLLIKPNTFMNESGKYLSVMMSYFKCLSENVILVHDELTLPFGEIKVSQKKGRDWS